MGSFLAHLRPTVAALPLAVPAIGAAAEGMTVQWYGQSAARLQAPDGRVIVIDPFISNNPATPDQHRDLDRLGNVDLILVTHAHGDHVGDTAEPAGMTGTPEQVDEALGDSDVELVRMEPGNRRTFD